ncbi:MAG TPA: hypothetical protein VK899_09225, partial [Gemmatimonadales bacterium]|nr:hypothetical protein [Gemmatimonadales bacterium]
NLQAMADRYAELHADRARLQAELDQVRRIGKGTAAMVGRAVTRAVSDRVGSAGSWGFTSGGKFASLRFAASLSRWERCRARYRRT